MRLDLNYGRGSYPLDLPDHWDITVIRKPPMPVRPDAREAVRTALSQPVDARPLAEEARGKTTACILICDITRPVPNGLLLPEIVRQLLDSGMKPANITVLVATGLHRPNEGAELEELIGDAWVLNNVKVANHFARNDADHVNLGPTPRGTPVKLDRRFVEADVR
ncbi:MAG TPA: lactate racemase domain-containing protein, partial [Burkholderiales bacterium]|nr:lactate racemase domain-containing protein [Burkholderiales bacterium]